MTQKERDAVIERLVDQTIEHAETSAFQHGEIKERLARLETESRLSRESSWSGSVKYLISESTKTTVGTVALLVLFSILIVAGSAVALGSDKVLEILATRLSFPTASHSSQGD